MSDHNMDVGALSTVLNDISKSLEVSSVAAGVVERLLRALEELALGLREVWDLECDLVLPAVVDMLNVGALSSLSITSVLCCWFSINFSNTL